MNQSAYDTFSVDYDQFVNWEERLKTELPFLVNLFVRNKSGPRKEQHILDAACGTGRHTIALAEAGFRMSGADASAGMIKRARETAQKAESAIDFQPAAFGKLSETFKNRKTFPFNGLMCLGNSLPHAQSKADFSNTLKDFAACLQTDGILILQLLNYEKIMREKQRWLEPQSHLSECRETVFMRFYDFLPSGLIDFNIVILRRAKGEKWTQHQLSTRLYPIPVKELQHMLAQAGFAEIRTYAGMTTQPFDPVQDNTLVISAWKDK